MTYGNSPGMVEHNVPNTLNSQQGQLPPYYASNAPPPPSYPPYGTVPKNWSAQNQNPESYRQATDDSDSKKKKVWFILEMFVFLLFLGYFTKANSWSPFGLTLYDWEALPKQFEFQPNRFVFQTVGGGLSEGHIHFKEGPGRVELRARISSDLVDDPELTYRLDEGPDNTLFEIHVPDRYYRGRRRLCHIRLDATVYVPSMDELKVRVQNTKFTFDERASFDIRSLLWLATTNEKIDFMSDWQGKQFVLLSTNARITTRTALLGADLIRLETTNARIEMAETIQANERIHVETTNDRIIAKNVLETPDLKLTTSNGRVLVHEMNAEKAVVVTTNAPLNVEHAHVSDVLQTKTTNSVLSLQVDTCRYCQVTATTSNSDITVNLPGDHEGAFSVQTSRSHTIRVVDELKWTNVEVHDKGSVRGERYNPEERAGHGGRVEVQTTNGDASLSFKA